MNTYFFIYKNMDMGGCQLLISKLSNAFSEMANKVVIYCETMTETFMRTLKDVPQIECITVGRRNWNSDRYFQGVIKNYSESELRIVTFLWGDYCKAKALCSKKTKVLLYAVHYDTIRAAADSKSAFLSAFRKMLLRQSLIRCVSNNSIIAMDEQTVSHSEQFYNVVFSDFNIVRIPVDICDADLSLDLAINKFYDKKKMILAIARAEFPFKGYLVGLLRHMGDGTIPKEFDLTIVSYGPNIDELTDVFSELDPQIKSRVTLLGKTDYSHLRELFLQAHVYIGMGTSLLDAAKYGVISIPVVPYSYEVMCDFFFYEHPEVLALETGSPNRLTHMLQTISSYSPNDVRGLIIYSHTTAKQMYSTQSVATQIQTLFHKMQCSSDPAIVLHHYLIKFKNILRSLMKGE